MKILLMEYSAGTACSGGYIYNRMMARHLAGMGHRIDKLRLKPGDLRGKLAHNFNEGIPSSIKKKNYHLVVQDRLLHPSVFLLNRKIKKTVDLPIIGLIHSLDNSPLFEGPRYFLRKNIEKAYLNTIDGFIATSESTRTETEKLLHRRIPSITAHPGRDTLLCDFRGERLKTRIFSNKTRHILFVGNLIPEKGITELIEALSVNKDREWHLDIVGDAGTCPRFTASIRNKIQKEGLADRVRFHGIIPGEHLSDFYGKSHILAVPSWHEGLGMAYLEAMGFGLAVIASGSGGSGELIEDGKTGFLVTPRKTKELAALIRILLTRDDLLYNIGINAYRRYLRIPDWRSSAKRISDFLSSEAR
ncbi:MAG: glycosyltransferase [Candidatus Omnitrophica bacterium]|nr:glycosyltransferase [Candidatus Omnitrophota bacterium]